MVSVNIDFSLILHVLIYFFQVLDFPSMISWSNIILQDVQNNPVMIYMTDLTDAP